MGPLRILAIDDNKDILTLEQLALEREGFEVITANSGKKALEMIPSLGKIDLILVDVHMDGMSGPEFLERLKTDHPEIAAQAPQVLVTGLSEPPPSIATGWIRKLTDLDEFVTSVKSFLKS